MANEGSLKYLAIPAIQRSQFLRRINANVVDVVVHVISLAGSACGFIVSHAVTRQPSYLYTVFANVQVVAIVAGSAFIENVVEGKAVGLFGSVGVADVVGC